MRWGEACVLAVLQQLSGWVGADGGRGVREDCGRAGGGVCGGVKDQSANASAAVVERAEVEKVSAH